MHLKRQKVPKRWPINRKGTTFIVRPKSHLKTGISLLMVLRDILRISQNRKEAIKAIKAKNILINGKTAKDEKETVLLFDVITIIPLKKHYRLNISEKGKFRVEEIKESEAHKKVIKIIGKKLLKGKKTQLNLSDGRNLISDIKCKINDSLQINPKEKKILNHLPLKENSKILMIDGKHIGKKGIVKKIIDNNRAKVNLENKDVNALIKQLIVIE